VCLFKILYCSCSLRILTSWTISRLSVMCWGVSQAVQYPMRLSLARLMCLGVCLSPVLTLSQALYNSIWLVAMLPLYPLQAMCYRFFYGQILLQCLLSMPQSMQPLRATICHSQQLQLLRNCTQVQWARVQLEL
jgi:hypothetical protein